MHGWYQIRIAGEDLNTDNVAQRLHDPLPEKAVIHVVPRAAGAKSSFFQVVLGAALMGFGAWNPLGWSATLVGGLSSVGTSMALGGVIALLSPVPQPPKMRHADNGRENTYFSSLDNMIAQGNPVPIAYGEMRVGSRVISQEISVWDESQGEIVVIGMR